MIRRTSRAFTLIELLIVVAIIGIISSATMAFIVAPAEEQAIATVEMEAESGLGTFFSHLVADAHDAGDLTTRQNPAQLVFHGAGKQRGAVVYRVDDKLNLRRADLTPAEAESYADNPLAERTAILSPCLLTGVEELSARFNAERKIWRIRVRARVNLMQTDKVWEREADVIVGPAWAGGEK